jgi:hypothetical protein
MSRRPRHSWTSDQKKQILGELRRRMASGESLNAASKHLGIHASVLGNWLGRGEPTPSIQPVDVVDARELADREAPAISVATPDGFFFDGLDLAAAIQLWERLR